MTETLSVHPDFYRHPLVVRSVALTSEGPDQAAEALERLWRALCGIDARFPGQRLSEALALDETDAQRMERAEWGDCRAVTEVDGRPMSTFDLADSGWSRKEMIARGVPPKEASRARMLLNPRTKNEERVERFLLAHPGATVAEVREELGVCQQMVLMAGRKRRYRASRGLAE